MKHLKLNQTWCLKLYYGGTFNDALEKNVWNAFEQFCEAANPAALIVWIYSTAIDIVHLIGLSLLFSRLNEANLDESHFGLLFV